MSVFYAFPNPRSILDDFFISSNFTEHTVDVSSTAVAYVNGTLVFVIPPESISDVSLYAALHR